MRTPLPRALGVAALAALAFTACGGDDDGDDPSPSGSDTTEAPSGDALTVDALDSLRFDPDALTAPAGEVAFELVNEGSLTHTLVIEGREDEMKLTVGSSDSGSIELEAGEYVFYCDVAGHRAGGMEGTLTVE